ncbi:MAG: M23 family metallopeptidase, partial [Planctomycetota bacterium]
VGGEDEVLELRVAPEGFVIASEVKPVGLGYQGTTGYYDMVVQAIGFVNTVDVALTLEEVWIDVLREGKLMQRQAVELGEVARATGTAATLQGAKNVAALEVLYSYSNLSPENRRITPHLAIEPDTMALVDDVYIVTRGKPDTLRVTVIAHDADGIQVKSVGVLQVKEFELQNEYIFPVEAGHWFVLAFPGLRGHHRWSTVSEHAIDITQVDPRGAWATGEPHAWHEGLTSRWSDWHAYGKHVLAAADGKVVEAWGGDEFPLEIWGRREDEGMSAYSARIGQLQSARFAAPGADPMAVAGGNYVIIEHAGGEFSLYAHLASGSLEVKQGDEVVQGQHIANVGGTGEMPAVHLHFQIGNGPTVRARTFPLEFSNVRHNTPFAAPRASSLFTQPGFFLEALEQEN